MAFSLMCIIITSVLSIKLDLYEHNIKTYKDSLDSIVESLSQERKHSVEIFDKSIFRWWEHTQITPIDKKENNVAPTPIFDDNK